MSAANPKPNVQLDLSGHDFKTVIRALTGDLNRTGKKAREVAEARELGLKLLGQYVRHEQDRVESLERVLDALERDGGVAGEAAPPGPEVTVLRRRGQR